jgi:hypothetical protein
MASSEPAGRRVHVEELEQETRFEPRDPLLGRQRLCQEARRAGKQRWAGAPSGAAGGRRGPRRLPGTTVRPRSIQVSSGW